MSNDAFRFGPIITMIIAVRAPPWSPPAVAIGHRSPLFGTLMALALWLWTAAGTLVVRENKHRRVIIWRYLFDTLIVFLTASIYKFQRLITVVHVIHLFFILSSLLRLCVVAPLICENIVMTNSFFQLFLSIINAHINNKIDLIQFKIPKHFFFITYFQIFISESLLLHYR